MAYLLLLFVQEDWGELNVGKRPPSLFVLDLKRWSLKAVKGLPQDSSVGQPEWTPDGMHLLHFSVIAFGLTCEVQVIEWLLTVHLRRFGHMLSAISGTSSAAAYSERLLYLVADLLQAILCTGTSACAPLTVDGQSNQMLCCY